MYGTDVISLYHTHQEGFVGATIEANLKNIFFKPQVPQGQGYG